jgi:hypothetical protein
MLNITYHPQDEATAQRLRADLSNNPALKLERPMLIVLASAVSLQDEGVRKSVTQAKQDGKRVAVLSLDGTPVEPNLGELPALKLKKYNPNAVVRYLNRVDLGAQRVAVNRRLLFFFSAAVLVMFFMAVWGVSSGNVVFPVSEYQTRNAINEARIDAFIHTTLEGWMPRTTQDALNFSATVDALPTRFLIYTLQTATYIPLNAQATQEAIGTSAAATSAALTAQPTPTAGN